MAVSRTINAIDVWAAGGPHRVVLGGLPPIKGRSIAEKQAFIRQRLPGLPHALTTSVDDPAAMVAAILTEPCDERADFGLIWIGCGEFMNLCGTGTFALGTVLAELGWVPTTPDGATEVVLEIPIGLQHLQIHMEGNRAARVSTRTSPAYFHRDLEVEVSGHGPVFVEVAYGLNCLEPLIDCGRLGIDLVAENRMALAALGQQIVSTLVQVAKAEFGETPGRQLSFYQDLPEGTAADFRCMAIVGDGEIDGTPSGTSTCAQLAMRHAKGRLRVGEVLTVESITGARLSGCVVDVVEHKGRPAVVPEISGSGHITRRQAIEF